MTDIRVGKLSSKALAQPTPDIRVGRVSEKALAQPTPDIRVGRVSLKVMIQIPKPFIGWGSPIR